MNNLVILKKAVCISYLVLAFFIGILICGEFLFTTVKEPNSFSKYAEMVGLVTALVVLIFFALKAEKYIWTLKN